MENKNYTILQVEPRDEWTGKFGTFKPFALRLEGVEGWVELSQKPETPAPQVNDTIHGHTESQTHGDKTYLKFKKVNPEFGGNSGSSAASATGLQGSEKTLEYVVQMLEELTGRRRKPDVEPDEADIDEAIAKGSDFSLDDIPFG